MKSLMFILYKKSPHHGDFNKKIYNYNNQLDIDSAS